MEQNIRQESEYKLLRNPFPGDLPNPEIKLRSPELQMDSLPAEPQGMTKNTGVGGLSLLQQTFPMQESNRSLLHCRQILYQLSYQGSPIQGPSKAQFKYHLFHNISPSSSVKFVFFLSILFFFNFCLFLAVLGLCCWVGFSRVVMSGGYSSCGAQASHYSGLSWFGAQAPGHTVGFSSCSSWGLEHRLDSCGPGA